MCSRHAQLPAHALTSQICDQPHPLTVKAMLDACARGDIDAAYDGTSTVLTIWPWQYPLYLPPMVYLLCWPLGPRQRLSLVLALRLCLILNYIGDLGDMAGMAELQALGYAPIDIIGTVVCHFLCCLSANNTGLSHCQEHG